MLLNDLFGFLIGVIGYVQSICRFTTYNIIFGEYARRASRRLCLKKYSLIQRTSSKYNKKCVYNYCVKKILTLSLISCLIFSLSSSIFLCFSFLLSSASLIASSRSLSASSSFSLSSPSSSPPTAPVKK